MSEMFYKREVLRAFPDAAIRARPGPNGAEFRVVGERARYPLSGYRPTAKEAWEQACADLPKRARNVAAGQASLFGGGDGAI